MDFTSQLKIKQGTLSWFSFLFYFLSCVSLSQREAESQGAAVVTKEISTGAFPFLTLSARQTFISLLFSQQGDTLCVQFSIQRKSQCPSVKLL